MPIESPIPRVYALLSLALPLVLAAGFGLASVATRDRGTRRVLAPGFAVAIWLLAVCSIARAAQKFFPGVVAGTLLVALGGAVYAVPRLGALAPRWPERKVWPLVVAVIAFVIAIVPAVKKYFHDETVPTGHLATVAQLQNGHYPPRYSFFPQYEFKYHYGFDVLAGMASALFGTDSARSIDVVTVAMWAYSVIVAAHLGRRLFGARYGIITAGMTLFAGGLAYHCPDAKASLPGQMLGDCFMGGFKFNPPVSALFFQHPFGLGIPLGLTLIALLADRARSSKSRAPGFGPIVPRPRIGRYLGFAVLLLALFLGQVVMFLMVGASLLASECLEGRRVIARRVLGAVAVAVPVLVATRFLGAFFAPAPYHVGQLIEWHKGISDTLAGSFLWNERVYFGLFPLGLLGIALARRERLVILLITMGGVAIPNMVRYTQTWDIVKFATVAQLFLGLAASGVVVRLLQVKARWWLKAPLVALTPLLVAACVSNGVTYHLAVWMKLPLKPNMEWGPAQIGAADKQIINFIRVRAQADEIVYRRRDLSFAYNQLGGLNPPWLLTPDNHGFGPKQRDPRFDLLNKLPPDLAKWVAQGITWFVIDGQDGALRTYVDRWVNEGKAEVVLTLPNIKVVHVKSVPMRVAR